MSPKDYQRKMVGIENAEREGSAAPDSAVNAQRRLVIRLCCYRYKDQGEIRDGLLILKELIEKGDFDSLWAPLAASLASGLETCISDKANKRSLEGESAQ